MADAFFVAFRFPNLFRRLFGEGAFNSAFVPLFAERLEGEGREAARAFAEEALAGLVFVLLRADRRRRDRHAVADVRAGAGLRRRPRRSSTWPCCSRRIAMPYLLCMSLVALLSGVLNSHRQVRRELAPSRSSST